MTSRGSRSKLLRLFQAAGLVAALAITFVWLSKVGKTANNPRR